MKRKKVFLKNKNHLQFRPHRGAVDDMFNVINK